MSSNSHTALKIQSVISTLLFLTVVGLLAWLGNTYHKSYDLTRGAQNSLTETSQKLLKQLDKPLKLTAYVPDDVVVHKALEKLVEKYKKYKKDVSLEIVNPDLFPERAKKDGIQYSGQLLIKLGENSEAVNSLDEQLIVNVLQRLSRDQPRLVVFIEGHGERNPIDETNNGMSKLTAVLEKKGFHFQPHNLLRTQSIPDDASFVIIAAPEKDYLEGEVKAITDYLEQGGNLLWLVEPNSMKGLADLEQKLGLLIPEGTILDANKALQDMLGIQHPAVIAVVDYGLSVLTKDLTTHTMFPFPTAVMRDEEIKGTNWSYQPLLSTLPTSWSETGDLHGDVKFDDDGDRPGPLDIGMALTRPKEGENNKDQRILVLGDSNFLLNSFIGQGSNLEFASNVFNWLGEDDELLSIKSAIAPDTALNLQGWALYGSAVFFLLLLPIGLLLTGVVRWLRRGKR